MVESDRNQFQARFDRSGLGSIPGPNRPMASSTLHRLWEVIDSFSVITEVMAATMFDCSSSMAKASHLLSHSHRTSNFLMAPPSLLSPCSRSRALTLPSTLFIRRTSQSPAVIACKRRATVIDGEAVAKKIRDDISAEVSRMQEALGVVPGLAVIHVGERDECATYVRKKEEACKLVGISSYVVRLPSDSSEDEVLEYILGFNSDPNVHGILVQLPLPLHINGERALSAINIEKDVDGFHPVNMGLLAMKDGAPFFVPCTPKGCIELLHRYRVGIEGKRAVVIGRSNIVGIPTALLLQREDATVSIVHSKTNNPEEITRQADIIISAAGQPNLVRGSWIKPGAVVINVGAVKVEDPKRPKGHRHFGDVCYEEACQVASAITPAVGGVGPMTIAMLLTNTLTSAKRILNFD